MFHYKILKKKQTNYKAWFKNEKNNGAIQNACKSVLI